MPGDRPESIEVVNPGYAEAVADGVWTPIQNEPMSVPNFKLGYTSPALSGPSASSTASGLLRCTVPEPSESNAARHAWRAFQRLNYGWRVPLSSLVFSTGDGDETLDIPYASPLSTLAYLMQHHPSVVVGGVSEHQERAQHLKAFWHAYQQWHPEHPVFREHGSDLSRVLPICWHGDEGRGKKRNQTVVISIESCIGIYTSWNLKIGKQTCTDCGCSKKVQDGFPKRDASSTPPWMKSLIEAQQTNMKGHSFLQHFPVYILPGSMYKEHKNLMHACLDQLGVDLKRGFYEGIEIPNQGFFFMACVGAKGDLKWFARSFALTRSFEHLGRKKNLEMCHECEGGTDGLPWEDVTSDDPCWSHTSFSSRPWSQPAPQVSQVPYDLQRPEKQIKRDAFHLCKVGIYRDFLACSILLLVKLAYFGSNGTVDDKLERAWGSFSLWCKTLGKTPGARSFNKRFFNAPNWSTYAYLNSKGSDTMLIMKWMKVLCVACKNDLSDQSHLELLDLIYWTATSGCNFFDIMNSHGLFLTFRCATALWKEVSAFIRGYAMLAHKSFHDLDFSGFSMKPKLHLLRHEELELFQKLSQRDCHYIPNPIMFANESNEDFIGRCCRLSRRCDTRLLCQRVIQSVFLKGDMLHRKWLKNGPKKSGRSSKVKTQLRTRRWSSPGWHRCQSFAMEKSSQSWCKPN